ncbi:conserved hypothetical protein [Ricinus communis]|uniref:Uncharacterized protein n=1 Tax=Ricinus communis TaxID=3988 RepID=B9SHD3_RICCO|nr:conserved hypothetical protein [Ricinus communis]
MLLFIRAASMISIANGYKHRQTVRNFGVRDQRDLIPHSKPPMLFKSHGWLVDKRLAYLSEAADSLAQNYPMGSYQS